MMLVLMMRSKASWPTLPMPTDGCTQPGYVVAHAAFQQRHTTIRVCPSNDTPARATDVPPEFCATNMVPSGLIGTAETCTGTAWNTRVLLEQRRHFDRIRMQQRLLIGSGTPHPAMLTVLPN